MSVPTIRQSDLEKPGRLSLIGQGGEGIVYDIDDLPDVVFKKYLQRTGLVLNRVALERLIRMLESFTEDERRRILSRTAWPTDLVVDGTRVVGYLMPRIPPTYWRKHGASANPLDVACDLTYLTHRNDWQSRDTVYSEVPRLQRPEILELIADLSQTIAILHRHNLVMGDISGKNLLWTDQPDRTMFAIDCDAFRLEGQDAINPVKESPDWGDPAIQDGKTNRASDVYKLALVAYRSLGAKKTARPPESPQELTITGAPDELIDLMWRSFALDGGRPSAEEWAQKTRQIVQFGDRPVITLNAQPPAPWSFPPVRRDPGDADPTSRPVIPVR